TGIHLSSGVCLSNGVRLSSGIWVTNGVRLSSVVCLTNGVRLISVVRLLKIISSCIIITILCLHHLFVCICLPIFYVQSYGIRSNFINISLQHFVVHPNRTFAHSSQHLYLIRSTCLLH